MLSVVPPFVPGAVVFDLDGVLVDSEGLWAQVEQRVALDLGASWEPAVQEAMLGRGPAEAAQVLARHAGHPDPIEVQARLLAAALEVFAGNVRARTGAPELVVALAAQLPVAVATNSRRELAEVSLAAAGLREVLSALVTADDVPAAKPDPAPYLEACRAVGVAPERALAFEDSPVGARSARAAGCWVIGCPMTVHPDLDAAHVVVADLADLDPDVLVAGHDTPARVAR